MNIQKQFIVQLLESCGEGKNLASELVKVLAISKDSVYRRLRGETEFTISEISKMCSEYQISFDAFNLNAKNTVSFAYTKMASHDKAIVDYFEQLSKYLEICKEKKAIVRYAAEDIPVFRNMEFDYLASFKLFYWQKSVLNSQSFQGIKFSQKHVDAKLMRFAKETISIYQDVDSVEIWTESTIDSTLNQVLYFWNSGMFEDKNDAFIILDEIKALVNKLNDQAESGNKKLENSLPNFKLYNCEVFIGNNCVQLDFGRNQISILGFNTFNSLATNNPIFNSEIKVWMNNMIKKSNLISNVSEINRYQFIRILLSKIDHTRSLMR